MAWGQLVSLAIYAWRMSNVSLVRPKEGRVIAGVAAGLADRFGMSRTAMRVLFVVLTLFGFPLLVYPILWIVIPEE